MAELKIPEVILRERRARKLTQEQLAAVLDVSPQAVSNWERGGYPDITLLPRIANFFGISVDVLIGNDEVTKKEEVEAFFDAYWKEPDNTEGHTNRLRMSKEIYEKYPENEQVLDLLGDAIIHNMDTLDENLSLLRKVCQQIMDNSTDEYYRRKVRRYMIYVATDEEVEDVIHQSGVDWSESIQIGILREERLRLHKRWDDFYTRRNTNDLLIFMQYLGRNNMDYYLREDTFVFAEAERVAGWEAHKMRLLSSFGEDGIVPEAWCGCLAEASLKWAAAMIACGRVDEGFARLEATFPLYERWLAIPPGALMDVGCPAVFGGAQVTKCSSEDYMVYIVFPGDSPTDADTDLSAKGRKVWTPYLWLFWQLKGDIAHAMMKWSWFDGVKEDPRYTALLEKAKKMAEI